MAHSILLWLRAIGFKSWSGRMFVIEVVPVKCSKLLEGRPTVRTACWPKLKSK